MINKIQKYQSFKEDLVQVNQTISTLIYNSKSLTGMSDHTFDEWEKVSEAFNDVVSKDIIRVAVVGAIKSGKSTFVNALYKRDYLKRGAGVVTSIVTRIRTGQHLRAKLFFKSWADVNSDMDQALVLFPSLNWRSGNEKFDITQKRDRTDLQHALDTLSTEQLITNDSRDINSVLLSSYLKGYADVKGIISSKNILHEFEDDQFLEHRPFVGNDFLAVYLRDIQLEVDSDAVESPVEIADCQGSDSPNPLHLAMIQDYLLLTHFIIYVISSRTGLRRADIKFLSMIKRLGIMENILFVVNCDISEHESIDDLKNLINKIKDELSLILPNPHIYTFSSLFNLFKAQGKSLSSKDGQRLTYWKGHKEIIAFLDKETRRFGTFFHRKLEKEKSSLLLKNHLERLGVVAQGIENWLRINQDVLLREKGSIQELTGKIKFHQERIHQIRSVMENTLDGVKPKIKDELKRDVDKFFDIRSKETLGGIIDFIRGYGFSYNKYEESLEHAGFSNTLYMIFQEFKQSLDTFIAEVVNSGVVRFIREIEKTITKRLESVVAPYDAMAQDALREYSETMAGFGIVLNGNKTEAVYIKNIDSLKSISGIKLLLVSEVMHYSARIRTEAVVRLGFYSAVAVLKKILKKPIQRKKEKEILALKDSILQVKRETEKSVISHFKDYKENIKYQYVLRLVDAVAGKLHEELTERIQVYASDLSIFVDRINNKRIDKEHLSRTMNELVLSTEKISGRIDTLRTEMDSKL